MVLTKRILSMQIHKIQIKSVMSIFEDNLNNVSNFKSLNDKLKKDTLDVGDKQNHSTNVKASMTHWRMMTTHSSYQDLLKIIVSKIPLYADIKQVQGSYPDLVCGDMWGAVYRKGQHTQEHAHSGVFSFTYYVQALKGCAPLIFNKPGYKKLQPQTGSLYIWKSEYSHYVPAEQDDNLRIVIAGNLGYFFGAVSKTIVSDPVEL